MVPLSVTDPAPATLPVLSVAPTGRDSVSEQGGVKCFSPSVALKAPPVRLAFVMAMVCADRHPAVPGGSSGNDTSASTEYLNPVAAPTDQSLQDSVNAGSRTWVTRSPNPASRNGCWVSPTSSAGTPSPLGVMVTLVEAGSVRPVTAGTHGARSTVSAKSNPLPAA